MGWTRPEKERKLHSGCGLIKQMRPFWLCIPLLLIASPTLAVDAHLELTLAGEAYKGPPAFSVKYGDVVLGTGVVTDALDTSDGHRLEGWNVATHSDSFTYTIHDFQSDNPLPVTVEYLEDAWGGEGTLFDRNLYLVSARLNETALDITSSQLRRDGETKGYSPSVGSTVQMTNGGDEVILPIPASVSVVASTQEGGSNPPGTDTNGVPSKACELTEDFSVLGFVSNSTEIPDTDALMRFVGDGKADGCRFRITGYSSTNGPTEWNNTLAGMRAQAVAAKMRAMGVVVQTEDVVVGGPTQQFGAPRNNQRVVVHPTPAAE